MKVQKEQLAAAIEQSWSGDTTSTPDEWGPEHIARGQCVPTSLVVQDYLGGDLERLATIYNGTRETHYRNLTDDGVVDLSRSQYPADQTFEPAPIEGDIREYVLGNENTRRRYLLLSEAVAKLLSLE